ncbi:cation:proton antiporter [Actinocrispum wychmicini]|uniref:Kef-type K+ transport system membrane component KefB n=1 Tax=Actinocrispum wychmicini TaxID=1213861 RepID=A0A4R2IPV8_9PSEU|nr:cation:proton antiporter [Actinocrispum wychmicini]TCO44775.1 Kef-type K+ transport system membrane component KefB [Actinocrispum wychmicini]
MNSHNAMVLLLDLALILAFGQVLGMLARRLDQPAVIGEIVAGVLVGPTLFDGRIAATLFPTEVRPMLSALATIGVALFMFLVGLELDRRAVLAQGRVVVLVSAGSLLVPFGLGVVLALWLGQSHPVSGVRFVLFMGTAMAVTAFPVLARILVDRGMDRLRVGRLALASAAVGDVVAWILLAAIVASGGTWQLVLVVPYVVIMVTVVPRLLRHGTGPRRLAVILVGVLLSGGLTEWMGLHFIFGAFLLGVVVPRDLRTEAGTRIGPLATLLLPVYFVVAGFQVNLAGLGATGLTELGLIILVAVGGKFAGVYTAARVSRLDARSAATLATLMNTRGLTELVLLTIGLQVGLLDIGLYSLMVAMAVFTTVLSGPLLRVFSPASRIQHDVTETQLTERLP